MTARSSNSTYCQDEVNTISLLINLLLHETVFIMQLGLAEEFKKPIINLRAEDVSDMDPGLKLIIQRRQVAIQSLFIVCLFL